MTTSALRVDHAFIGGGLATGLAVLAIRAAQPGARIAVVERDRRFGGNHTWCVHDGDVPAAAWAYLDPLVRARWAAHEVAFPGHRRVIDDGYACLTGEALDAAVVAALAVPGSHALTGHDAEVTGDDRLRARGPDGATLEIVADAVLDARGPTVDGVEVGGYQKFLGQELELAAPHQLTRPILMDATVEQLDGFRFVYVLPLSPTRLLVEDTYYSDTPTLDRPALRARIAAYLDGRGLGGARALVREEEGALPLPARATAPSASRPLTLGYRGGWMHPVTGYSLPLALRVAEAMAQVPAGDLPGPSLTALAREVGAQLPFALRLNRMLFGWFPPARRFHVLERFYRLPTPTLRRFYALALTRGDRARILCGRPPRGMSWRAALVPGARA
ncbi:MAG: lycopene beta-cyclase CrtY [Kofleriaceae bacterium]